MSPVSCRKARGRGCPARTARGTRRSRKGSRVTACRFRRRRTRLRCHRRRRRHHRWGPRRLRRSRPPARRRSEAAGREARGRRRTTGRPSRRPPRSHRAGHPSVRRSRGRPLRRESRTAPYHGGRSCRKAHPSGCGRPRPGRRSTAARSAGCRRALGRGARYCCPCDRRPRVPARPRTPPPRARHAVPSIPPWAIPPTCEDRAGRRRRPVRDRPSSGRRGTAAAVLRCPGNHAGPALSAPSRAPRRPGVRPRPAETASGFPPPAVAGPSVRVGVVAGLAARSGQRCR